MGRPVLGKVRNKKAVCSTADSSEDDGEDSAYLRHVPHAVASEPT
jgi:hypothetical protein